MSKELAFVMINPYSLAKSRTGGVIARIIGRTPLDFVAARMFGPGKQLIQEFADVVRASYADDDPEVGALLSDYILRAYGPNPADGRPRRVMLLLFEGDHAVDRVAEITGLLKKTHHDCVHDSRLARARDHFASDGKVLGLEVTVRVDELHFASP